MRIRKYLFYLVALCFFVGIIKLASTQNNEIIMAQAAQQSNVSNYVVKEGENAFRIALNHNIPLDSLKVWNNLNELYTVFPGKILYFKNMGYYTYKNASKTKIFTEINYESDSNIQNQTIDPEKKIITKTLNNFRPNYLDDFSYNSIYKNVPFSKKISSYFWNTRALLRILIILIVFFIISVIGLFILITTRRIFLLQRWKKQQLLTEKYSQILTNWLYEEHDSFDIAKLKIELNNKLCREIFLENFLNLHRNLSGESAESLNKLYHILSLKTYALKKINNKHWFVIAKGLRELSQMNITDQNLKIETFLNSPNSFIRTESRLAWIKLNPLNPLPFLNDPNVILTDWGQLNTVISIKKYQVSPDFNQWLSSTSKKVILYSLKMIAIFKQFRSIEKVFELLNSNDEEIRKEAIKVLASFGQTDIIIPLQKQFETETLNNKIEIISALNPLVNMLNIDFFKKILLLQTDPDIRLLAAKGLFMIGEPGTTILDSILENTDETTLL